MKSSDFKLIRGALSTDRTRAPAKLTQVPPATVARPAKINGSAGRVRSPRRGSAADVWVSHAGQLSRRGRSNTVEWQSYPNLDDSMGKLSQEIRFCTTGDGVRIAFAKVGTGPPLVKAANWLNHLEFDWDSPVWRHVIRELSRDFTLVRYDERGNGLSDWQVEDFSFESFVADLEAVVDAVGLDRFSLLGISQGCAVSVAYAVRHPERVEKLVLHGGYAVGGAKRTPEERERREALYTLAKTGWGQDNPAFRQVFTSVYLPDATLEEQQAWNELQRIATPVENALRLLRTFSEIDVSELLSKVEAPTLVLHSRGELAIPLDAGRALAAGIPDARMVTLDTRNHLLMEHEPEWPRFLREVRAFLGADTRESTGAAVADQVVTAPSGAGARQGPAAGVVGRSATKARLESGARIGRYRVDEHLASGGMAAVYRARDLELERDVAIKILPEQFGHDEERVARFIREAKLLAALNHPRIAAVHGLERSSVGLAIILELVDGTTLEQRLATGPLTVYEALHVCAQIGEALEVAHGKGIVHRDLKPANVMLTEHGVKVLDLGIAKVVPEATAALEGSSGVPDGSATLTATGALLGTGPYMSPEQVRGGDVGPHTDLWAFGCVLYETLTGRSPFLRETLADTLSAILETEPDWNALPEDLPRSVREMLPGLLRKDSDERLGDIAVVRRTIGDASGTSADRHDEVERDRRRGSWMPWRSRR